MSEKKVRLDKFLALNGFSPRRSARKFLKEHEFRINGVEIRDPDTKFDLEKDVLLLDGEEIQESRYVYYALHKAKNVISTTSDELGREDVTSSIATPRKIYPIGRLDKETTGLILLTDDGELTHQLTHPRFHVEKVYLLTIEGSVNNEQIENLRDGVKLKDGKTLPAKVEVVSAENGKTILQMGITEGRNRQIRRMCLNVGIELLDLQRIAFGPVTLGTLTEGQYRELTTEEITSLQELVRRN